MLSTTSRRFPTICQIKGTKRYCTIPTQNYGANKFLGIPSNNLQSKYAFTLPLISSPLFDTLFDEQIISHLPTCIGTSTVFSSGLVIKHIYNKLDPDVFREATGNMMEILIAIICLVGLYIGSQSSSAGYFMHGLIIVGQLSALGAIGYYIVAMINAIGLAPFLGLWLGALGIAIPVANYVICNYIKDVSH